MLAPTPLPPRGHESVPLLWLRGLWPAGPVLSGLPAATAGHSCSMEAAPGRGGGHSEDPAAPRPELLCVVWARVWRAAPASLCSGPRGRLGSEAPVPVNTLKIVSAVSVRFVRIYHCCLEWLSWPPRSRSWLLCFSFSSRGRPKTFGSQWWQRPASEDWGPRGWRWGADRRRVSPRYAAGVFVLVGARLTRMLVAMEPEWWLHSGSSAGPDSRGLG